MKKSFIGILFAFFMTFTIAGGVGADEAKPAKTAAENPAGTPPADIKTLLGMSIYLQGGYNYNFRNPDSQENDLRIFDHKANSFSLDLAQIMFTKDAPLGGMDTGSNYLPGRRQSGYTREGSAKLMTSSTLPRHT